MIPVRVKICGVRTPEDAVAAAELGADAIGLILVPGARRQVTLAQARAIMAALPPFVSPVGVFVDAAAADVAAAADALRLRVVQLHGDEPPDVCRRLQESGLAVVKAVRVADRVDRSGLLPYAGASALLLDTHVPGLAGGTGRPFAWEAAAGLSRDFRIIVAGGLNPDNVTQALRIIRPYGVDVTSGVETDGRKDPEKLRAFIQRVRTWEHGGIEAAPA